MPGITGQQVLEEWICWTFRSTKNTTIVNGNLLCTTQPAKTVKQLFIDFLCIQDPITMLKQSDRESM